MTLEQQLNRAHITIHVCPHVVAPVPQEADRTSRHRECVCSVHYKTWCCCFDIRNNRSSSAISYWRLPCVAAGVIQRHRKRPPASAAAMQACSCIHQGRSSLLPQQRYRSHARRSLCVAQARKSSKTALSRVTQGLLTVLKDELKIEKERYRTPESVLEGPPDGFELEVSKDCVPPSQHAAPPPGACERHVSGRNDSHSSSSS